MNEPTHPDPDNQRDPDSQRDLNPSDLDRPDLTYPEEGGTRRTPLPPGYSHLRQEVLIGHGRAALAAAGEAVTTFRMHRAAGVGIRAGGRRAAPGMSVEVSLGIGPLRLRAPCRVVWVVAEEDRVGFAYGTLDGHPECGEEAFVVERRADDSVWFTVTAFSRPARLTTRLGGPLVPVFQRWYARHCGRTLRRLTNRVAPAPPSRSS
ncbi:DUF1990 domain-containing protein [Streptomyces piniterrae]|uniref:DUF1990 domain-containing protein n=1 Tax=Streptomyces piniterrae TaxID=2571125 RepID=A0A4U0NR24_9ACTN|nr:DUF1990 domain-containing protein [Streptomyces piniterrae]TJZ56996.1 DUF1990 domain-containing protein [Streptomyces piniterrae]